MTIRNGIDSSRYLKGKSLKNLTEFRDALAEGSPGWQTNVAFERAHDAASFEVPDPQKVVTAGHTLGIGKPTPLLEFDKAAAKALLCFLEWADTLSKHGEERSFPGAFALDEADVEMWRQLIKSHFFG